MHVGLTVDRQAFAGPQAFANWVLAHAVPMVAVNRLLIRKRLIPVLYQSGVVFEEEPDHVETLVDALTIVRAPRPSKLNHAPHTHWGDCWHLACWRCAELQEQGEKATIRVKWAHPNYHVQVRRTKHVGQPRVDDPFVEDPSRILGMKG